MTTESPAPLLAAEEVFMHHEADEKRANRRYDLQLPLRYRVSQKGELVRFGTALTTDLSAFGVRFRCRKPLPVGAHIELMIDWPARYAGVHPVILQVTGFIVRSGSGEAAVRLASRRLRVESPEPLQASA